MASRSFPMFVSVDTEFTDGNFIHGTLLEVGLAVRLPMDLRDAVATAGEVRTLEVRLPLGAQRTEPLINGWVRENMQPLLERCRRITGGREKLRNTADQIDAWLGAAQAAMARLIGVSHDEVPIVFVAWCGTADWAYLAKLFYDTRTTEMAKSNPFHYDAVEIGSLAMGVLGIGWGSSAAELCRALDLAPQEEVTKHTALGDAVWQLHLFEGLMARRRKAV